MSQPANVRLEIGAHQIEMPKPVNFLRYQAGGDSQALDVALFCDDTLEDLGRAIGQAFIANAKKRRLQKESPSE